MPDFLALISNAFAMPATVENAMAKTVEPESRPEDIERVTADALRLGQKTLADEREHGTS